MPNPKNISDIFFILELSDNKYKTIPTPKVIGANPSKFKLTSCL